MSEASANRRDEEIDAMWREYETASWLPYYRKAYRGGPFPEDLRRWIRNDGVADWRELGSRHGRD
jgi:hypothetical protein